MVIRRLDDQLISQIAAGEVVERPASVVKELVENSLDAGARTISVDVEQGGLRYIGVGDDGAGIAAEQLRLALSRHATSKIDSLATLESAPHLGFRGEALASIASVARLRIQSRPHAAEHGHGLDASTEAAEPHPVSLAPGTRTEVHELFSRVPARRKFLKTPATEFRHVQRIFNQLALSRFDVGFELHHDARQRNSLPVADTDDAITARVRELAGRDFVEHAIPLDEHIDGMRLSGWVATPGFSRSRADLQYCFVNDRAVRDALISHAVRDAYRDLLHGQRHPAFILYLEIDPGAVDVNAHPAKSEIRFRQSRLVHDFVARSLGRALAGNENAPTAARTTDLPVTGWVDKSFDNSDEPLVSPSYQSDEPTRTDRDSRDYTAQYRFQMPSESNGVADAAVPSTSDETLGYALAQLHGIYILAENEAGLIVVDMHAAHERVLYERLKAEHTRGQLASSRLLVPASLNLSREAVEALEQYQESLAEIGFEIIPSGGDSARLSAIPEIMADRDYLGLARDVVDQLTADDGHSNGERARRHTRDLIDDVLADVGCKAAIKAGRRLTIAEMNQLLRDMAGTHHAGHCNHGRPSWVQVDRAGLDRMFMRGQ